MKQKCVHCEVPWPKGLEIKRTHKYVSIHSDCLNTLDKKIDIAMRYLQEVGNQAHEGHAEVYHTKSKSLQKELDELWKAEKK